MERYELARQGLVVNNTTGPFCFYADAQATIAALQARVKELEEITKVICGHCCEPMEIPSKAVLQSALTQRTAELEAAKRERTN